MLFFFLKIESCYKIISGSETEAKFSDKKKAKLWFVGLVMLRDVLRLQYSTKFENVPLSVKSKKY